MSTIKNDIFYEWVKGDYTGNLEKITSEEIENGIEWINFESGRRINKSLFGEFLLINENGVSSIEPIGNLTVPVVSPKIQVQEEKLQESPISILLKTQKKRKTEKMVLEFDLELPSPEILLIMYESFGEDLFSEIYKMNLSNFKDSLPSKFDEAIKSYLKIK
jgi:hypothetical protein